jgi:hypothetical protein
VTCTAVLRLAPRGVRASRKVPAVRHDDVEYFPRGTGAVARLSDGLQLSAAVADVELLYQHGPRVDGDNPDIDSIEPGSRSNDATQSCGDSFLARFGRRRGRAAALPCDDMDVDLKLVNSMRCRVAASTTNVAGGAVGQYPRAVRAPSRPPVLIDTTSMGCELGDRHAGR